MSKRWLTTAEFAQLAGISERKARRAIARALADKPWRGVILVVEPVFGPGGLSGKSHLVDVASLPLDLQERLKESMRPAPLPVPVLTQQRGAKHAWLHHILLPLLPMPDGSERRAAVTALAARRDLTDWLVRPIKLSERTIYNHLRGYRLHGPSYFAPHTRSDKGRKKTIISLALENAIPFDTETWKRIAAGLRDYIRGHYKEGATFKLIQFNSNIKLRELISGEGFNHFDSIPAKALIVPRVFIIAERHYTNVHTLHHDRKTYEDNKFRTQRSRALMKPMDWVVFDVHPVDIAMYRADGSTAHARMVAFLDIATNRLRFKLFLCDAGTGIHNADMITAFCEMLDDPTWGMPATLYLDNGQENNFVDKLNDALALIQSVRGLNGQSTFIKRALPYNASAKPIEGMFAIVEKLLQDLPGHTGGDRMNKKTHRVGRPTKAFAGTLDELISLIQSRILAMELSPMRGHLAGKSPRQAYEAAIESGWQPVAVDPAEILTVFADDRLCTINKGVIQLDNRRWACPEMSSYFERKIIVRVPRFWPMEKLALLHVKTRELIGIAEPVEAFAFDDARGAMFTAQVDKRRRDAIRALDKSAPDIDTAKESLRIAAQIPPATVVAPIARIGLSREAAAIAGSMTETPAARADRQREENLKEQRRQSTALANTLRALRGDK
jgi:hypothetical protein